MSSDGPSDAKRPALQAASAIRTKGTKRKQPAVYSGSSDASLGREPGITCPICFNIIESAYMTKCGHSFCQKCIEACLEKRNQCPKCNRALEQNDLFPNFTLNEVILRHRQKMSNNNPHLIGTEGNSIGTIVENLLNDDLDNKISVHSVSSIIDILEQKRRRLLLQTEIGHASLTLDFLNQVKCLKEENLSKLTQEISVISSDIKTMSERATDLSKKIGSNTSSHLMTNGETSGDLITDAAIRQRINLHSNDLQDYYFSMRSKAMLGSGTDGEGLNSFTSALSNFVKYKEFKQLATLNYTSDMYNMYSIVSSIEFDKDSDYFAIAGVTKKIKVYDYKQVVTDVVDMHYPVTEMSCASKISCVAWNPYHKNELVSSDYEGTVTMWDPFSASKTHVYQEHEKRCWCVDFNRMNPHLIASGSDDSKVKIWSTNTARSVLNIEAMANVCCVKFNPNSSFHLAFGAADHCVHYYDIRRPVEPLLTFKGHLKAVSYTKFLNGDELVSASTDSQLKLWNVKEGTTAVRTFRGHVNEKNFVGLASDSDFIACGSEDNSLCVYYKGLSKILHKYKFDIVRSVWQRDVPRDEDSTEFVSAVAWKPDSGVIIVANSQGIVKVLELV